MTTTATEPTTEVKEIYAPAEEVERPRVLVAGQLPPPICGQNLNILRVLRLLERSRLVDVEHWKFNFTPTWSSMRRASFRKALEVVRVWWRIFRLRLQGKIDVVLYPVGGPHLAPSIRDIALLPLALLCSRKVILHFRSAGLAGAIGRFPAPIRWALKKIYQACHGALALSEFGKCDPEAAGIKKIKVLSNGTEDRRDSKLKKSERHPDEPITILNAGLLCADKGTPELLKAFAEIHAENPNTRLKLVGEPMGGLTEESILETARELGFSEALELTGVLEGEALMRAFATADFFVFATVAPFESFGMVLIEAMMWELPIVATDWRANAEVLGENFGGKLASVDDPENFSQSLSQAIREVIVCEDEWSTMGIANRKRFLERYRVDRLEERLVSLLTEFD